MYENNKEIQIYQDETGALEIQFDSEQETIWLTQTQIGQIFGIDQSVVSRHITKLFKTDEVDKKRNMHKMHIANSDKLVTHYSLDVILAVGYKTNSNKAIRFRKWSNLILKDYLLNGAAINKSLLNKKTELLEEIIKMLDFLERRSSNIENNNPFLEILKKYINSLIILNQYDEDRLKIDQGVEGVKIEISEFRELINQTKKNLINKNEASEIFGKEYPGMFESTVASISQSFNNLDLYTSLEEKAANLFYL